MLKVKFLYIDCEYPAAKKKYILKITDTLFGKDDTSNSGSGNVSDADRSPR